MRLLFTICLLLAVPRAAGATPRADAAGLGEGEKLTIDGRLDEQAWGRATPVTDFFGTQPVEGAPVEADTSVRVLFDDKAIYFGFDCPLADEDDRVRGYVAAREDVNRDDQVGVYLDPFGDARRAYVFYINALGVQQDALITIDGVWSGAWDARFRSVGRHERGRYTVEIAIPWRSLRFPKDSTRPWRVRFTRRFGATQAKASWPPNRRDDGHVLLQFGELHGITPKRGGIGLELQPSLVVRTGLDRSEEEDRLVWREPGFPETVDPSVGIKWQITPSMTLDATVNPDFSQVEADPNFIDSNLRFPIFLQERRPFFLEGRELYDDHLLYTRAVVNPLYGLKLSGKARTVTVALLHALDETPTPSFVQERSTPGFDEVDEQTMAFVTYAGSRLDLPGRSSLGVTYSDKQLIRGREHLANHHGLRMDGIVGLDENSTARGAIALSDTGAVGGDRVRGLRGNLSVGRSERFGSFNLWTTFVTPGYRAENGFLFRTDRLVWGGDASARFEPKLNGFDWVRAGLSMDGSLQHVSQGPERDQSTAGVWADARLPGITDVRVWADGWATRFAGRDFEGGRIGFRASNRGLDILAVTIDGEIGDTIRFADATKSFVRNLGVNVALRALRRLKLDLTYDISALGLPGEQLVIDQVWQARLRVGFTQALSLRLIAQGSIGERLDLSALLEFQPSAGTAVFIGWGHRFVDEGVGKLQDDAVDLFLKGTLQIRL